MSDNTAKTEVNETIIEETTVEETVEVKKENKVSGGLKKAGQFANKHKKTIIGVAAGAALGLIYLAATKDDGSEMLLEDGSDDLYLDTELDETTGEPIDVEAVEVTKED